MCLILYSAVFHNNRRDPPTHLKNQCNTRRGFLLSLGFILLFVKLNFCVQWMQWELDLTLLYLTIQMKTRIIMTRKHIQIAQPLLPRMWWDTFYYLWNKYSFLPCNKELIVLKGSCLFFCAASSIQLPFFGRRDSTAIPAEASRVHKIQTGENDQTKVASLFVCSVCWEPRMENGLAPQAPFLLLAAPDYLSPMWFGIQRLIFFSPLGFTHQKDYMQQN